MAAGSFDTFSNKLAPYLEETDHANSEASKALAFLVLIRSTFEGVVADNPRRLIPQLEKSVKIHEGSVLLRGRIDALLGNLVIEFKMDLDEGSVSEAVGQLKRYVAGLWALESKRVSYMLMATDGVRFKVFRPSAPVDITRPAPNDIRLESVNIMDLSSATREDAYLWLDRYVLWRDRIPPRSAEMVRDFGLDSPTFIACSDILGEAWRASSADESAPFNEWKKYLRIVYGSEVGSQSLFLKHTYLATLAKLMVYTYYTGGAVPSKEEIERTLVGEAFKEWGIQNFLEEDFFSWIAAGPAQSSGTTLARKLLHALNRYDLTKLNEDVLKGLYQGLVDPESRHDLGEYYTPDWLAELVVSKLTPDSQSSLIDPACGSGTFLSAAIRQKADAYRSEAVSNPLERILASVKGIDIHPLAVLVAKANYLMALGDLVKTKTAPIHVPVYLANSIVFPGARPDIEHGVDVYRYPVSRSPPISLAIPSSIVKSERVGTVIEATTRFARQMAVSPRGAGSPSEFDTFLQTELRETAPDSKEVGVLWETCRSLAGLMTQRKDSIYAYLIKNIYRPSTIGRFDCVMGNPPWLPYRDIRTIEYQEEVKKLVLRENHLLSRPEQLSNLDISTLFFARAAELYLRPGGLIGFVMTRAIFNSEQHDPFRRFVFSPSVGPVELLDLESVAPLFRFPSCVVIAKKGERASFPVASIAFAGSLPEKNIRLAEFQELLRSGKVSEASSEVELLEIGRRSAWAAKDEAREGTQALRAGPSPYARSFRIGASLTPRRFWWVKIAANPILGMDSRRPHVVSSDRAIELAKRAWKGPPIVGNVEREFIFAGLLGSDVLPFGTLPLRPVVLPVEAERDGFRLISESELSAKGQRGILEWVKAANRDYLEIRGAKAADESLYQWLDWAGRLSRQRPRSSHWVVYNKSGTHICAATLDTDGASTLFVENQPFRCHGVIVDDATVYFQTNNGVEADYLAGILNAPVINAAIKPIQARGLWGARSIQKKPLEIGIPEFRSKDRIHLGIAEIARACKREVGEAILEFIAARAGSVDRLGPQQVGRLRSALRARIAERTVALDELARQLLRT